jgi:signal transduction histidine kinase
MTVATASAAYVAYRTAYAEAANDELLFAALVSELPRDRVPELVGASNRWAQLVDPAGEVVGTWPPTGSEANQAPWNASAVAARALDSDDRQFVSQDRNGNGWLHSSIAVADGHLVVSRLEADLRLPWRTQSALLVATGSAAVVLIALWTAVANHRLGRAARLMADVGDQLRVRGELPKDSRKLLDRVAAQPYEFRRMADNFVELEHDIVTNRRTTMALVGAGSSLGGSLDPQTVLNRTLEQLEELLGVERSAVARLDPRTNSLTVVASRGHSAAYLEDLALRSGYAGSPSLRSLREQTPIQIPDTEADVVARTLRDRARRHGYRSVLAIPLMTDLQQPTVMLLHHSEPRTYSFDEVDLSSSFAAIAGAALRNAELFATTDARLRTQTSRLEAIAGSVREGLLVEDGDGRLLFANSTMASRLPGDTPFVEGMDTLRFLDGVLRHSTNPPAARRAIEALTPDDDDAYCDVSIVEPDGSAPSVYRVRAFAVTDRRGERIGQGQTWRNISRERELEQMKTGLLAAVSHEFRTPLTLIKGYATTLLAEDVTWDTADRTQFLQLVSDEADRLADLVKSILDMRRIDANMVRLQPMPMLLGEVVADALVALPHERHRIDSGPLPELRVNVDLARMVTVFRNLLENACKYSPPDARVGIVGRLEPDLESVVVSISDEGPGIPAWLRERIFETFVRAESGLDAAESGIGLGLSIAKGFVEAHGGRIWVEDPEPGITGTVFSISLPVFDRPPSPAAGGVAAGQDRLDATLGDS